MEEEGKPFQCLPTLWRETNTPAHSQSLPPSPEYAPFQRKTRCYLIASFTAQHLPESYNVTADLPRYQPYVFPLHITTTDQRPDIVVWSATLQEVWVIELTVCFETRYEEAHNLKVNRYADLMEQIDDSTHSGSLVTLEVGSRGILSLPSFTLLKQQLLICTRRQWEEALSNITRTAISGSHRIWVTRNYKEP